jgi:hypothetical protein
MLDSLQDKVFKRKKKKKKEKKNTCLTKKDLISHHLDVYEIN